MRWGGRATAEPLDRCDANELALLTRPVCTSCLHRNADAAASALAAATAAAARLMMCVRAKRAARSELSSLKPLHAHRARVLTVAVQVRNHWLATGCNRLGVKLGVGCC